MITLLSFWYHAGYVAVGFVVGSAFITLARAAYRPWRNYRLRKSFRAAVARGEVASAVPREPFGPGPGETQ